VLVSSAPTSIWLRGLSWLGTHFAHPRPEVDTMRPDIAPGGTFPDYELPDHASVPRKLSEIQGDDPLILTLARVAYAQDLGAPGLREAWDAGDYSSSHGWDKRAGATPSAV
jgi:hypothetical protein